MLLTTTSSSLPPRRLRKYIGPQSYCNWPDLEARQNMEKAVRDIQAKADLIYNKFKSHFAFQVTMKGNLKQVADRF